MIRCSNLWAPVAMIRLVLAVLLGMGTFPSYADTAATGLSINELVDQVLAARNSDQRDAAIAAVMAQRPDSATVAGRLGMRRYAEGLPTGWLRKSIVAADGVSRPYVLHVPVDYDPQRAYRLVIEMHGAVTRESPASHELLETLKSTWGDIAESDQWLLAFPAGERGAAWWDPIGSAMVLDIVRETKRSYHVDSNQVFATGFSDGGSGAWFLAASHPTPFAGFIAMSGHPSVADMGGVPMFLRILKNRPIYATNSDLDQLFPSAELKPIFDALAHLGAPTRWQEIHGVDHNMRYIAAERPAILRWMQDKRRNPAPRSIAWEGDALAPARVDWLQITEVSGGSGVEPFVDVNPLYTPRRGQFGARPDKAFDGKGVRLAVIVDGSTAARMKLAAGDVITQIDGAAIASMADYRAALRNKLAEDGIAVQAQRGDIAIEAEGRLLAAPPRLMFERERPYGSIQAELSDNTYTVSCLGIAGFAIFVSPRNVDMSKPVHVVVNGKRVFSKSVETDLRFMLAQAAQDDDPALVYHARIDIVVPTPGASAAHAGEVGSKQH